MASPTTPSSARSFNLQRAFPLLVALTVTGCTYLQARALNALISHLLLGSMVRPLAPVSKTSLVSAHAAPRPSPLPLEALATTLAAPATGAADCSDVRLSVVSELDDPDWSLATLQVAGEPRAHLRRRGDPVGNRHIVWIGTEARSLQPAVWLEERASTRACRVELFRPPREVEAPSLAREAEAPSRHREALPPRPQSLRELLGPVRAIPELEGGSWLGVRLLGIRPNSLLAQIGLRNGDRLDSINGYRLADPEQALLAYSRLRETEHFKLRITREGAPLEFDYRLTGPLRHQLVTEHTVEDAVAPGPLRSLDSGRVRVLNDSHGPS